MLCDNISLFYSAIASLLSQNRPNKVFSYGLVKIEIVSSLVNAILLVFIAFNLMDESVSRLINPPTVLPNNLLLVSVLGLVVNLFGLLFTGWAVGDNVFLKSIFLHVLVDTLGSVAVIISAFCVTHLHIFGCDPICSMLIAFSILWAAGPLLKDVCHRLMLTSQTRIKEQLQNFLIVDRLNTWDGGGETIVMTAVARPLHATMTKSELNNILREFFREHEELDVTLEIRG
jgi:zinc transporter 5/7